MAHPAYFPKLTHTRAIFRCPKCRADTLGRWRDHTGEVVRANRIPQIFGANLIGWCKERVIEIQTKEKLLRRSGCFEIRFYEDRSLDVWSLPLIEPDSPKGHFCNLDVDAISL